MILAKQGSRSAAPYAVFGLLFMTYAAFTLLNARERLVGDEWRYLWHAQNLLRGYYTPPEFVFICNGPGYPLLQAGLLALGVPLLGIRLVNALLLTLALVLFWKLCKRFASARTAYLLTCGAALYLPVMGFLPFLYTEVACFFLVTCFAFSLHEYLTGRGVVAGVVAGLSLGALVLTKVGFWPVIVAGAAVSAGGLALRRGNEFKRALVVFGLAFLTCVPWLIYTYQVTGRPFFWASGGGSVIYWMSHPYAGQYGDWLHQGQVAADQALKAEHWPFLNELGDFDRKVQPDSQDLDGMAEYLSGVSTPEADDAFRAKGIENLRRYPLAYARNWVNNVGRLVIDYPYTAHRFGPLSLVIAVCNASVLLGVAVAAVRLARKELPAPRFAFLLLVMLGTFLGVMSLISATGRFFVPAAPLGLILVALTAARPVEGYWQASRAARPAQGGAGGAGGAQGLDFEQLRG